MDKHTQDGCFPIEEDTAPLSPKRLRTDCTITNKHSCKTHFQFPEPLSFRDNDYVTSLQNRPILQEDKTHRVESDHEYLKYTVTGFHCEEMGKEESTALGDNQTCAGSCVISPHSTDGDSQGLCQGLDKQYDPLSETGTSSYSFHSRNEAGCASAKSQSSDDRTTDTSSSHDFNQPGKSLKCALTSTSPSAEEEAVTEQNGESRIPVTDHSSSVSDGTEEPDYTCESLALNSAIYSMGFIKGSAEGENNHQIQNEDKHGFNQSICYEKEARHYPLPSDYREDCESSGSHAETEPFGNFTGVKKNEGNVARLQNDVRENADVCNREAKAQVNKENFMHSDSSASAETVVEYVDGSVVTCYTVLDSPVLSDGAEINMGPKHDDLREPTLGHAVGTFETLCELGVDHNTTQKLSVSTDLSQKPADVNRNKIASVTEHAVCCDVNGVALETTLHPPQPEDATSPLHPPQPEDTTSPLHPPQPEDTTSPLHPPQPEDTTSRLHPPQPEDTTSPLHPPQQEDTMSPLHPPQPEDTMSPLHPPQPEDTTSPLHPQPENTRSRLHPPHPDLLLRTAEYVWNATLELSFHFDAQNGTQLKGEYEDTCQLLVEQCSCTTEEHDTSSQGIHHWEPLLSSTPGHEESYDAEEGSKVSSDTAKHLCEEWDTAGQVSTSKDYLKTHETVSFPSEGTVLNGIMEENSDSVTETDLHVDSVNQDHGMIPRCDMLSTGVIGAMTSEWINNWPKGELFKIADLPILHLPAEATPGTVLLQAAKEGPAVDHTDETEALLKIENNHVVPFTSVPNDAVVPGSDSNPEDDTVRDREEDRSVSVMSSVAHILSDCVPVGFDTFEKIQLCPLDTNGLEQSPLLSSSPSQTFKTDFQHHSAGGTMHSGESDEEDIAEEEEDQCQEEAERGFFHCENTRFNEIPVPDFISPQISPSLSPEMLCQSYTLLCGTSQCDSPPQAKLPTLTSDKNIHPVSETHDFPGFEIKERFDMVMEELSLYFEISDEAGYQSSERATSELCRVRDPGAEEDNTDLMTRSSSDRPSSQDAMEDEPRGGTSMGDDDHGLKTYQAEPETTCTTGGLDCEQEVPLECCHHSTEGEDSMYSSVKHKDHPRGQGADEKCKLWSPAFMFLPCLDQLSQRKPEQHKRLEPLKTCTRPIRVGLSKKAKTKQLHPYSK